MEKFKRKATGVSEKGNARREAQALGLKRYRDGRTCKHGHKNPERFTSCARCIECHKRTKKMNHAWQQEAKKIRKQFFGFDPLDLRYRRKARNITPSERPDLVRLRQKRKQYGRKDRPSVSNHNLHQSLPSSEA